MFLIPKPSVIANKASLLQIPSVHLAGWSYILGAATAGQAVRCGVVVPARQGNAAGVEAFVGEGDDLFVAFFADDNTGCTPGEIVHVPEGPDGEDEGVDGVCEDVDDHPACVESVSIRGW